MNEQIPTQLFSVRMAEIWWAFRQRAAVTLYKRRASIADKIGRQDESNFIDQTLGKKGAVHLRAALNQE